MHRVIIIVVLCALCALNVAADQAAARTNALSQIGCAGQTASGVALTRTSMLPPLQPKSYRIGIAPSHIASDPAPLFSSADLWQEARSGVDFYKFYSLQTSPPAWCKPISVKEFVAFCRKRKLDLAAEFGGFVPDGSGQEGMRAAERALRELQPLLNEGARIVSIHLDGPIYQLLRGVGGEKGRRLSLEAVAAQLVVLIREARKEFPGTSIGFISNFPNWDYTEDLPGMLGGATSGSGVTYARALETVHRALSADGGRIDFVEVDCPYQYYIATNVHQHPERRVDSPAAFRALQAWCSHRGIAFQLIVNAEPRAKGADGARRFHEDTLAYVRRLRADGIFPDAFTIQSWYAEPAQHLPESEPNTFMHTAREAAMLIRSLYPQPNRRTETSIDPPNTHAPVPSTPGQTTQ